MMTVVLQSSQAQENAVSSTSYPRVCCRPLRKFSHSRLPAARLLGLAAGGFDHCFIELQPGYTTGIHPVEPRVANKQPVPDEETDSIAYGGECKKIEDATPEKMQRLQKEIDARTCYSCGRDYHNSAGTGYFNNSNTYVFDLLKGVGMTPPVFPHAPGYKARPRPSAAPARESAPPGPRPAATPAITAGFPGASRLLGFSRSQAASLLVYVRTNNNLALLQQGTLAPLDLKTRLSTPGFCCDHRALPALSHRGGRLAYVRMASVSPHREVVSVYDPGVHSQTDVFEAPDIWAVSWSPADERMAIVAQSGSAGVFAGENDLYVIDLSSKQTTQLTQGSFLLQGLRYAVSPHAAASWDPAGKRLAVEVRRSGEEKDDAPASAIAIFSLQRDNLANADLQSANLQSVDSRNVGSQNLDSQKNAQRNGVPQNDTQRYKIPQTDTPRNNAVTKLTDGAGPSWSPVEDRIAFLDEAGASCFTIHPDGSGKKELFSAQGGFFSTGPGAPIFFPVTWSPTGDQLLFHQWADEGLVLDLYRFDLATAKARLLGRGELQVVDWR
ncbi:MAG: hypothetical protein LAP21_17785 [Acidobacteriia bacterium]|nr:hypothetical protein [Terriglobia bacterium]